MLDERRLKSNKSATYQSNEKKNETNIFGVGAMDNHKKLNPSTTYREDSKVIVCCCVVYNCGGAINKERK
ncbi:hypothetical protein D6861_008700 [Macrococcoides caseolyticum]